MSLHYKLSASGEHAINTMKKEGYDSFSPPIYPHELERLCSGSKQLEALCDSMIVYCQRYAHDVFEMMKE